MKSIYESTKNDLIVKKSQFLKERSRQVISKKVGCVSWVCLIRYEKAHRHLAKIPFSRSSQRFMTMFDEMIKRVELLHLLKLSTRLIAATEGNIHRICHFRAVSLTVRKLGTTFQTTPSSSPQKLVFNRQLNQFTVPHKAYDEISVHPMLTMGR